MNMDEVKTIKQAVKLMQEYNVAIRSGQEPKINVADYFELNAKVLESLMFKVEELERQIGLGPQFINMDDVPTRLR